MFQSTTSISTIAARLQEVCARIRAAEERYGRLSGSVELLAISKTHSAAKIQEAHAVGQTAFGENYIQEALPKIQALQAENIVWHYTGRMQTNKAKYLAQHFDWVQSVTHAKHALHLNQYRSQEPRPPLNVCIEVNLSGEVNKAGVALTEIMPLAYTIATLPHLKLRGLMAIPQPAPSFAAQLTLFQELTQIYQQLKQQLAGEVGGANVGVMWDTLSMGMSGDFEAAIAAGSTMVRIGTAIFGQRE